MRTTATSLHLLLVVILIACRTHGVIEVSGRFHHSVLSLLGSCRWYFIELIENWEVDEIFLTFNASSQLIEITCALIRLFSAVLPILARYLLQSQFQVVSHFGRRRLDLDFTCYRHASFILRAVQLRAQLLLLLRPGLRVEQVSNATPTATRSEATVDGFGILCVIILGDAYLRSWMSSHGWGRRQEVLRLLMLHDLSHAWWVRAAKWAGPYRIRTQPTSWEYHDVIAVYGWTFSSISWSTVLTSMIHNGVNIFRLLSGFAIDIVRRFNVPAFELTISDLAFMVWVYWWKRLWWLLQKVLLWRILLLWLNELHSLIFFGPAVIEMSRLNVGNFKNLFLVLKHQFF